MGTAAVAVGAVAGSALASDAGPSDLLVVVALPLAFAVAGLVAVTRRPAALSARALLLVGVLHLAALMLQAGSIGAGARGVQALAGGGAVAAYLLGFVALLGLAVTLPARVEVGVTARRVLRGLALLATAPSLVGGLLAEEQRVVFALPGYGESVRGLGLLPAAGAVSELGAPLLASPVACAAIVVWRAHRATDVTRSQLLRPALVLLVVGAAVVVQVAVGQDLPAGLADAFTVFALGATPFALLPTVLSQPGEDPRMAGVVRTTVVLALVWTVAGLLYAAVGTATGAGEDSRRVGSVALVAALGLAPLVPAVRRLVARASERLALGRPVDGYRLLLDYGSALGGPTELEPLCQRTADVLRTALGARWAEVALATGERGLAGDGRAGDGAAAALSVPLAEGLGVVRCGPRRRGPFSARDHEAVEALARQTSLAVRSARLTSELAQRMDELEVSRGRLAAAGDAERRRIERDLHDGTQQDLVALLSKVELTRMLAERGEGAGPVLAELRDDVVRAIASLRRTVSGIHPPALTDLGLDAAVRQRVQDLPVPVGVRSDLGPERLPASVETAAYYVVVESLTNVLKHARCTRADVRLALDGAVLRVTVSDDGQGGADQRGGTGLAGLQDRVAVLGGSLDLRSPAGAGTTVTARLPLS